MVRTNKATSIIRNSIVIFLQSPIEAVQTVKYQLQGNAIKKMNMVTYHLPLVVKAGQLKAVEYVASQRKNHPVFLVQLVKFSEVLLLVPD